MLCRFVLAVMLGLAGMAVALPAQAAKKVMVADCEVGGCRCTMSSLTVNDVQVLTGEAPPRGAEDMTFVMAFDDMYWVPRSLKDIHRTFGGSGDCPIEVFPVAEAQGRGPRDGIWEFRSAPTDHSKCPISTVFAEAPLPPQRMQINWGGRFDPDKLHQQRPAALAIRWARIDASNWRGTVGGANTPFRIAVKASLLDRETIEVKNEVFVPDEVRRLPVDCLSVEGNFSAHWISAR